MADVSFRVEAKIDAAGRIVALVHTFEVMPATLVEGELVGPQYWREQTPAGLFRWVVVTGPCDLLDVVALDPDGGTYVVVEPAACPRCGRGGVAGNKANWY